MSNWQTAAQEFHSAAEPWRKPLAELTAIVAAMRINAALASTHPDDRERWKDLADSIESAVECSYVGMAVAQGDNAYHSTGIGEDLQEAADALVCRRTRIAA